MTAPDCSALPRSRGHRRAQITCRSAECRQADAAVDIFGLIATCDSRMPPPKTGTPPPKDGADRMPPLKGGATGMPPPKNGAARMRRLGMAAPAFLRPRSAGH